MSEEFCDGVKILLKRMESNPDEFKNSDKWDEFVNKHALEVGFWAHALAPEEVEALKAGMRKIYREVFTNKVMAKLLEDTEKEPFHTLNTGGGGMHREAVRNLAAQNPNVFSVSGTGLSGSGGFLAAGKRVHAAQNAYPQLSPYAESQPPKSFWGSFFKGMTGR